MPRMALASLALFMVGCVSSDGGHAKHWEVSFGVTIESKLDENNKVTGTIQVGTPKATPTPPKVKP
jgi:hypothetical protein